MAHLALALNRRFGSVRPGQQGRGAEKRAWRGLMTEWDAIVHDQLGEPLRWSVAKTADALRAGSRGAPGGVLSAHFEPDPGGHRGDDQRALGQGPATQCEASAWRDRPHSRSDRQVCAWPGLAE
jgi:hypothetical protein